MKAWGKRRGQAAALEWPRHEGVGGKRRQAAALEWSRHEGVGEGGVKPPL